MRRSARRGKLVAAAATLVIAQLTVSWQAVRAARTKPIDTLRYE
jgi:hypothetical protein